MARLTLTTAALVALSCATACSTSPYFTRPTDTSIPATEVTETFDGQLAINGAVAHPFTVGRVGTVTVRLLAVDPADATIGLSLGTWNAALNTCTLIITNDAAPGGAAVVGTASVAGPFCVRVYDVGRLSSGILYSLSVTHF